MSTINAVAVCKEDTRHAGREDGHAYSIRSRGRDNGAKTCVSRAILPVLRARVARLFHYMVYRCRVGFAKHEYARISYSTSRARGVATWASRARDSRLSGDRDDSRPRDDSQSQTQPHTHTHTHPWPSQGCTRKLYTYYMLPVPHSTRSARNLLTN